MRIGSFAHLDDHGNYLKFLKQYGVDDVVLSYSAHPEYKTRFSLDMGTNPEAHWDFQSLVQVRKACEDAGMQLISIENPLPPWCIDHIILGWPGRDQQIENLAITIRNMGRAGVPVFGYNWMVNAPGLIRNSWRTSLTTPGRGGSQVSSFDMEFAKNAPLFRDREYSVEEMWDNYAYFLKAIVPVLEESGVRMAVHPDDPPVETLGGVPRLFNSFEGYKRGMEMANSPASGINMCLGNWTAMKTDIPASIRYFGPKGLIIYGHAQGVQGHANNFRESFLDDADCDFFTVLCTLKEVGFDSALMPGHSPHTQYEDSQGNIGLIYAIGYMKGILDSVNR
ncbi:MAG: mannonate dehydratase [Chloroflexi bacterium]|nr:mannonate dehydratase [Chloroflexota bacterium]